jgi:hypothetical protein
VGNVAWPINSILLIIEEAEAKLLNRKPIRISGIIKMRIRDSFRGFGRRGIE